MPTLNDVLPKRQQQQVSTQLLKGSALPRKQGTIELKVTGVRQAPDGFNSPAIMDFEPVTFGDVEYRAVPLNKTNTKLLMGIVGKDMELSRIAGIAVFQRVLQNNPQNNALTPGLQLIEFKLNASSKSAAKPKQKAGPASRRGGKPKADPKADHGPVPF
jgi:hypothetical protein